MSYASHLKITFGKRHSWDRLWGFFKSVLLLKAVDYLLFAVVLETTETRASIGAIAASLGVMLLRLTAFKKVFA